MRPADPLSVRPVYKLWQPTPGCDPIVIRSERQSKPLVRHPKIAVATDSDRVGPYGSDFLCNHPDVTLLAAVIGEAVVTEAVVEPAQQHDIVLQLDVRAAPTAATAAATAKATAATAAKASSATAAECRRPSAAAAAGEPGPATMTDARRRPEISGS